MDDPQLAKEILQMFLEYLPEHIKKIETSIANNLEIETEKLLHNLKGSSANISAMQISQLASELEIQVRNKKSSTLHSGFQQLLAAIESFTTNEEVKNLLSIS
jgi:HPt (histidine-containing phosphotransfer) domain-containing protein